MDDSKIDGGGTHPIMQALLSKMDAPKEYSVTYRLFRGPSGSETPDSILDVLELKADDLSQTAREALEALESSSAAGDDFSDLKWKLTAFIHIQDVFDSPFFDSLDRDPLLMFQQYYFYYESLRILRESVLCGLNGFAVAANALLRPFLEFSLLQNYFYRTVAENGSFGELAQYFTHGIAPKTSTVIRKAMPKDDFTSPIRFRVHAHLRGLSESTLHPYHPDHSASQHKDAVHAHSFESLHFWYGTRLIVDAALWVYFVNFPLLFHPVDVMRKFGYNGPVGLFIDEYGGLCVRKSLGEDDYKKFLAYSTAQQRTKDCLAFYANHPDLTDAAIEAMWHADEDGPFPGLWAAYGNTVARMRAMKGLLALRRASPGSENVPDKTLDRVRTLSGWRAISARTKP